MLGHRIHEANLKAIKAWNQYHFDEPWEDHVIPFDNSELFFVVLGSYRKTRVFCSNPFCCGNPRRIRGARKLTVQELKAKEAARVQLDEMV